MLKGVWKDIFFFLSMSCHVIIVFS